MLNKHSRERRYRRWSWLHGVRVPQLRAVDYRRKRCKRGSVAWNCIPSANSEVWSSKSVTAIESGGTAGRSTAGERLSTAGRSPAGDELIGRRRYAVAVWQQSSVWSSAQADVLVPSSQQHDFAVVKTASDSTVPQHQWRLTAMPSLTKSITASNKPLRVGRIARIWLSDHRGNYRRDSGSTWEASRTLHRLL